MNIKNKNRNQWGFTLFELLIVLIVVAIIGILTIAAGGMLGGCGVNWSNGTGTKIGQVVKLSKQGFMNKTWEGQLIRGGMVPLEQLHLTLP